MPSFERRHRPALVALLASLAAIVVVVWLGQPSDSHVGQTYAQDTGYPEEHHGPAEGHWWPEISARDTYAQWFMAIMALAATAVSIWAIHLLRQTLLETRRAAEETKRGVDVTAAGILNEQRPWLKLTIAQSKRLTFYDPRDMCLRIGITVTIHNFGNKPARYSIDCIAIPPSALGQQADRIAQILETLTNDRTDDVIFPNETITKDYLVKTIRDHYNAKTQAILANNETADAITTVVESNVRYRPMTTNHRFCTSKRYVAMLVKHVDAAFGDEKWELPAVLHELGGTEAV
jgi:hypothetical protein